MGTKYVLPIKCKWRWFPELSSVPVFAETYCQVVKHSQSP